MSTKQLQKSCKNRTYKRWVIVFFTKSNDYSVVPVNKLILPITLELTVLNVSLAELYRWPPFHVTSVELTNVDDPEDIWDLFKIKMLSNKIYGANFKENWHQRVKIESSATENESEVLKKKKKNRQKCSSEDDSDFECLPIIVYTSLKII